MIYGKMLTKYIPSCRIKVNFSQGAYCYSIKRMILVVWHVLEEKKKNSSHLCWNMHISECDTKK